MEYVRLGNSGLEVSKICLGFMRFGDRNVEEIAKNRGISMSQVALAWLMQKDLVVVPIVGVTKVSQLEEAVKAVSVKLTEEEIKYLEEPYVPHPIVGPLPHPGK